MATCYTLSQKCGANDPDEAAVSIIRQPPVLFCNTDFLQNSLVFLVFLETLNYLQT